RALPDGMGDIPVIALTAGAFPEDVAACRAAGMVAHLSKPVQRAPLLRVLADLLPSPTPEASEDDRLGALRPLLLEELCQRLEQLRAPGLAPAARLEAMQAVAGTLGHLDKPELVQDARRVLQALRDDAPDGAARLRQLLSAIDAAFPPLAPVS